MQKSYPCHISSAESSALDVSKATSLTLLRPIRLESVSMAPGLCHLKTPDALRASEECDLVVFYLSTRSGRVF
jgi:hypothetical protein